MTSSEDFPDEPDFPPVLLNSPDLMIGSIIGVDKDAVNDVRLSIRVRDENLDDELQLRATLAVLGETAYEFVCAENIPPSNEPVRAAEVLVTVPNLRRGACTQVEVFVSRQFVGACPPVDDEDRFSFRFPAFGRDDLARAQFWIWETSGDPTVNPVAAQNIVTTCQTVTRAQSVPMPQQMVP